MSSKKKKAAKAAKTVLTMRTGERYDVLCERGKYYVCDGTQFRKGNQSILTVEKITVAESNTEAEGGDDNADS